MVVNLIHQQQWEKELQKTKQKLGVVKLPIEIQKKQLKEEMEYFKTEFLKALKAKSEIQVERFLKKLITSRGRLLKLFFDEYEEYYLTSPDEDTAKKARMKYYEDCYKLTKLAEISFNK